jgi:hypothetical protein
MTPLQRRLELWRVEPKVHLREPAYIVLHRALNRRLFSPLTRLWNWQESDLSHNW